MCMCMCTYTYMDVSYTLYTHKYAKSRQMVLPTVVTIGLSVLVVITSVGPKIYGKR